MAEQAAQFDPLQPNVIPMNGQQSALPVNFQFSNDFKSAALWALIGVIGGMLLTHYMLKSGKTNIF